MDKINILDSRIQQLQLELEQTKLECEQEEIHKRESKIKMEPNLNMMSEWLENLDIMREYYNIDKDEMEKYKIDDKHLFGQKISPSKGGLDKKTTWLSAINCSDIDNSGLFKNNIRDHPKMIEFASKSSIKKNMSEKNISDYFKIVNEIKEEYQQKKKKLELSKLTIGGERDYHTEYDLPSEFMINFIESTYNMFNILNDRIKKLEENIKDKC